MIAFKYYFSEDDYFPVIPFYGIKGFKKIKFYGLIDSGASISVFREEIAQELGIEIEKGELTYLSGVGGRIKGYLHRLKIEVAGKKFFCPVIFSHEYLVSFNLLGRQEFFPRFKIIFEEKNKEVNLR